MDSAVRTLDAMGAQDAMGARGAKENQGAKGARAARENRGRDLRETSLVLVSLRHVRERKGTVRRSVLTARRFPPMNHWWL